MCSTYAILSMNTFVVGKEKCPLCGMENVEIRARTDHYYKTINCQTCGMYEIEDFAHPNPSRKLIEAVRAFICKNRLEKF